MQAALLLLVAWMVVCQAEVKQVRWCGRSAVPRPTLNVVTCPSLCPTAGPLHGPCTQTPLTGNECKAYIIDGIGLDVKPAGTYPPWQLSPPAFPPHCPTSYIACRGDGTGTLLEGALGELPNQKGTPVAAVYNIFVAQGDYCGCWAGRPLRPRRPGLDPFRPLCLLSSGALLLLWAVPQVWAAHPCQALWAPPAATAAPTTARTPSW